MIPRADVQSTCQQSSEARDTSSAGFRARAKITAWPERAAEQLGGGRGCDVIVAATSERSTDAVWRLQHACLDGQLAHRTIR
jgi:hypothetical protein